MSSQSDHSRDNYPHEAFACFAGMLFMYSFAYLLVAIGGSLWSGASAWVIPAYAAECVAILICVVWATVIRASRKTVFIHALFLIILHFVVFSLSRVFFTAKPTSLNDAVLVGRVLFYLTAASVGYWLACLVFFRGRIEVLVGAIVPGCLALAFSWWLLRDTSDANQVVTSVGMSLAFVLFGLLLAELSQSVMVRRLFSNRPANTSYNELQNAKLVHESMFPKPLAAESFCFGYAYRPMRQIGGDFIHIFPEQPDSRANGTFYLTLIDVTGHGISSALTVNRLNVQLQQYFANATQPCPSEALAHLNDYVRMTMAEHGLFATGMCVKVDTANGMVTVANAGHPLCYYRSASGLSEIEAEGPMLGVFPSEAFDSTPVSFAFEPGDQLVMVTDGAIESRSPSDEAIGTERLHRIIERSCIQTASPDQGAGASGLLQQRMSGRLLDRADVRKPVGLIQQVLRQGMNAHPCALADEIMLSIDDFVQQESQDDILIATLELLKAGQPQAHTASRKIEVPEPISAS
ncbi:MAG: PP2C family protein-serine/threonine phosphatase [Phycisphaeraceae bacterium]